MTREENFARWFHGRGVPDDSGAPQVYFHGSATPGNLTAFHPGGAQGVRLTGDAYGVASYFTSDPGEASFYARDEGAVFPVFLRGELLDVDGELTREQQDRLTAFAQRHLLPSDKARFEQGRAERSFEDLQDARDFFDAQRANWVCFGDGMARAFPVVERGGESPPYVITYTDYDASVRIRTAEEAFILFRAVGWDNLRAAGFDGLKMKREGGASWVVMHQPDGNVKSALGNDGQFDGSSADIRYSLLNKGDKPAFEPGIRWGSSGAGCVVVARSTGRILLPLRSEAVLEPWTWGTWGGAVGADEAPLEAACRELHEEAGIGARALLDVAPLLVYRDGTFRYHNFLALVKDEFEPALNEETEVTKWCCLDELPAPLHPGLDALLRDQRSMAAIQQVCLERPLNLDKLRSPSPATATVESMSAAVAEIVGADSTQLSIQLGRLVFAEGAEAEAALVGDGFVLHPRAQAAYLGQPGKGTTYFMIDRIPAGKEAAVFLHEIVHRHGRRALPEGRFEDLVQQLKGWAQRAEGTIERTVHDAAAARVATAGVAGPLADEELFAYAVEEAVARGVTPSAAAVEGSAQAWLHAVEQSLLHVLDKLLGNDQVLLDAQDLVDLAYGLAQLDRATYMVGSKHDLNESGALWEGPQSVQDDLTFEI